MRFLLVALLASASSFLVEGRELDAVSDLWKRWNMDEPNITYASENNTFTLEFPTASPNNTLSGMEEEFYDINCKDDGTGFTEYIIPSGGITGPDGVSAPKMTLDGPGGHPQLQFMIKPWILARDSNIWSGMTLAGDIPDTTSQCDATGENRRLSGRELYDGGRIDLCVRTSLGYNDNTTNNTFQEVNFIESLITVEYDLRAGFCVDSFNVEARERLEATAIKDNYNLEAWMCDLSLDFEDRTNPVRSLPASIPKTYLGNSTLLPNATNATYFNQGALLTVCVAPDDYTYGEGIRMDGITYFNWTRSDYSDPVTQEAIVNGTRAQNRLTFYDPSVCVGGNEYCTFSSILFADFFRSQGFAAGIGAANLVFADRRERRLGELEARRFLEEDGGSDFDVNVGINAMDDGPGALKTAGGVALRDFSWTLVPAVGVVYLLGAALLA